MPVTNSTSVIQTLDSVVIHKGGAVDVSVTFETFGFPLVMKTFYIAQEEALPIWGVHPSGTVNRWEDLCGLLYALLLTRGDLVGTLS